MTRGKKRMGKGRRRERREEEEGIGEKEGREETAHVEGEDAGERGKEYRMREESGGGALSKEWEERGKKREGGRVDRK